MQSRVNIMQTFLWAIIACFIFIGYSGSSSAQLSHGGLPMGLSAELRSSFDNSSLQLLPPIDSADIWTQEELYAASMMRGAVPFALPIRVNYSPHNSGKLSEVNGRRLWQLHLKSTGAKSLNFIFDEFQLPQSAQLFIYRPDGSEQLGAFTEENNPTVKLFATAPLYGDEAIIECSWDVEDDTPRIRLAEVCHDYKDFYDLSQSLRANKPGEPWFKLSGLACAPSVATHPEVSDLARSTVLVIARGSSVFSGALINNSRQDGSAYILTASHCMNYNFRHSRDWTYATETAASCVFFFGFESPLPSPTSFIRGSSERSLTGAELLVQNEDYDSSLVKITGLPKDSDGKPTMIPASYQPYFAGWNRTATPKAPFVAIHHPAASTKRYGRCDVAIRLSNLSTGGMSWTNCHWRIPRWNIGTTAGGSSGSPLFDAEGLIVGALTGGSSYCTDPVNDYYWAMSKAFSPSEATGNSRLALTLWLDPDALGNQSCPGYDPYAPYPAARKSHVLSLTPNIELEAPDYAGLGLSGVGELYDFEVKTRLLGAHLVITGLEDVREKEQFPDVDLVIYKQADDDTHTELYRKPISFPTYSLWNSSDKSFTEDIRTLGDTLDIFIPIRIQDSEGALDVDRSSKILVGIKASDSTNELTLPILRGNVNLGPSTKAYHLARHEDQWQSSSLSTQSYHGSYWVDLLTQALEDKTGGSDEDNINPKISFDGYTWSITFPTHIEPPSVRLAVYDYTGKSYFRQEFTSYYHELPLAGHIPSGNYLLQLTIDGRKHQAHRLDVKR